MISKASYFSKRCEGAGILILLLCHSLVTFGQTVYTTGYQPHDRTEAPGTLIFRSPTPEWGGRLTNIIYHQGWLMTGYENPGSNAVTNDLRFRVMDISNLETDPEPVPFWPSDFGQSAPLNNRGREHWYTGNWGYHTHGHGRTAKTVHWPPVHVDTFGGEVVAGLHPDELFNYGWQGPSDTGGRLRRHLPWVATHDWAYSTTNFDTILLGRAMKLDPTGGVNYNNYKIHAVAQIPGGNVDVRGFPVLLGEYFYIVSDQRMSGIAVYRVPDVAPLPWQSTDPIPQLELVGVSTERFGGYWPEIYASGDGRLFFVGTTTDNIQVMEVTDPTNPRLVRDYVPAVNGTPYPFTNASYPKFQDNLLLVDGLVVNMDRLISGHPEPIDLVLEAPATGGYDPSQYSMPLGNLVVTGGYGEHNGGLHIHVRQQARDTTRPRVAYHMPQANQSNVSRYHPISVIIHEELDSRGLEYGVNFTLREVIGNTPSGNAVPAIVNLGSDNILMITPISPLAPSTVYQVDFPEVNGITDISGNAIEPYSFRFSTGSSVPVSDPAPQIVSFTAGSLKPAPGTQTTFTVTMADNNLADIRFDAGEGAGFGAWTPIPQGQTTAVYTHTYSTVGRYQPRVQIRDSNNALATDQVSLLVWNTPTGPSPTRSSPVIVDTAGDVWAVNPDADTVTKLDGETLMKLIEVPVGKDPRSLAQDAQGRIWVTCFDSDELRLLAPSGAEVQQIVLPYGDAPKGVCASPDGNTMYVTAYGSGVLYEFSTANPAQPQQYSLGPTPAAIAVSGDHSRVWITQFISGELQGAVWSLDKNNGFIDTIPLEYDTTPDGNNAGAGVPNYLAGIAVSPLGNAVVVAGSETNVLRGLQFGTGAGTHENTVRAMVAVIDATTLQEQENARFDLDNSESPTGIVFTPDASAILLTLQGNNQVVALDAVNLMANRVSAEIPLRKTTGTEAGDGGKVPQGLAIDPVTQLVHVQNLMSRSVTVFDAAETLSQNRFALQRLAEVDKVAVDGLSPAIRLGKEVFYNAMDPRMGAEGYASCATCHVDGGHDGRVWDFSHAGEGLRRTTDLRGRAGMAQGAVHWSGNFDEIQDFELVMRDRFLGEGFLPDNAVDPQLGPAGVHGGISEELDALAAYVTSLANDSVPRSPHRNPDGSMTAEALRGRDAFVSHGCATCHSGPEFTASRSQALQNVGTQHAFSGSRLGSTLAGIDIPSLQGLHRSRVFGHMGQASTLREFLDYVGGTWMEAESGTLTGTAATITRRDNGQNGGGGGWELQGASAGTAVNLNPNDGISMAQVDGGRGGSGRIQVRVTGLPWGSDASRILEVRVNGVAQQQLIHRGGAINDSRASDFRFYPFDVQWLPGATNTVEVFNREDWEEIYVDGIVISRPEDLDLAAVHRTVSGQDLDDIITYLMQLDGSDDQLATAQPVSIVQQPTSVSAPSGSYFQLHVIATGSPVPSLQWQRNYGEGWVDLPGETANTLMFLNAGSIDSGRYRARIINPQGSLSSTDVNVSVTHTASTWRETQFAGQLDQPTVSGWSADPDQDGLSNRAEFVMGLNPNLAEPHLHPRLGLMPSGLQSLFEFQLASDLGDAAVDIFFSDDLTQWSPVPATDMVEVSAQNGVRHMRITRTLPPEGTGFFRIVTR